MAQIIIAVLILVAFTTEANAFFLTKRVHKRLDAIRGVVKADADGGNYVGVEIKLGSLGAYGKALKEDFAGTVFDTAIDVGSTALLGWGIYEAGEWLDEQLNDDDEKDEATVVNEAPRPLSAKSSAAMQERTSVQITDDGSNYNLVVVGDGDVCIGCTLSSE